MTKMKSVVAALGVAAASAAIPVPAWSGSDDVATQIVDVFWGGIASQF